VAEDSAAEEAAGAGAGTGDAGRSGAAAAAAVVIGASTTRGSAIASFSSMASKKKVKVDVERNDEENGRRLPPALAPVPCRRLRVKWTLHVHGPSHQALLDPAPPTRNRRTDFVFKLTPSRVSWV
jgi:hypothetical protein